MMSEEKVLKKLDITDFRHLTKDKVIQMASMLDKMDPEVAKKALEQFPEFSNTIKEILTDYKETLTQGLVSNSESVKQVYESYRSTIESLQKELENENLTFEQKKYLIEQIKEIAEKIDKKDSENKKFIRDIAAIAAVVIGGTAVALASVLGGNTQISSDDTNKFI